MKRAKGILGEIVAALIILLIGAMLWGLVIVGVALWVFIPLSCLKGDA